MTVTETVMDGAGMMVMAMVMVVVTLRDGDNDEGDRLMVTKVAMVLTAETVGQRGSKCGCDDQGDRAGAVMAAKTAMVLMMGMKAEMRLWGGGVGSWGLTATACTLLPAP